MQIVSLDFFGCAGNETLNRAPTVKEELPNLGLSLFPLWTVVSKSAECWRPDRNVKSGFPFKYLDQNQYRKFASTCVECNTHFQNRICFSDIGGSRDAVVKETGVVGGRSDQGLLLWHHPIGPQGTVRRDRGGTDRADAAGRTKMNFLVTMQALCRSRGRLIRAGPSFC